MRLARSVASAGAARALALTVGCGPKPAQTAPASNKSTFSLFPDPDDGRVGRAAVSTRPARVEPTTARASTTVVNRPPTAVAALGEEQVSQLFGATLSALAKAPRNRRVEITVR